MKGTEVIVDQMKPPERPLGVPETAYWCHNPGCEIWIDGKALGTQNRFHLTIYSHPSGKIDASGEYRLHGRELTWKQLKRNTMFFDGYDLYLRNGYTVSPVRYGQR